MKTLIYNKTDKKSKFIFSWARAQGIFFAIGIINKVYADQY